MTVSALAPASSATFAAYTTDADFLARAAARFALLPPTDAAAALRGDHSLNAYTPDAAQLAAARPAAVLIGIVQRPGGARVILTRRAAHLRDHSGQVAFPGGKIDAADASPMAAALREAHEEIGLDPQLVAAIGYLDPYLTGTGFCVLPVLAQVSPQFEPNPDMREVDAVFEPPLAFLMNPHSHQRQSREWQGIMRHFYAMPWQGHHIWGATAGMIRAMYERLYSAG